MEARAKILVIDDEEKILNLIYDLLIDSFDVLLAKNGEEGIESARSNHPDLILIDNIMPEMSGIDATQFLRKGSSTKNIPIIMLTALKEQKDRVLAFKAGVDDFISKPFHPDELLSRMESKIQRFKSLVHRDGDQKINCSNLQLNLDSNTIFIDKKLVRLTPIEFEIMKVLLLNAGQVKTREEVLQAVWQEDGKGDRLLDSHIASLRKKIKSFKGKITTIYGRGYTIEQDPQ